jgi:hypothetical protein
MHGNRGKPDSRLGRACGQGCKLSGDAHASSMRVGSNDFSVFLQDVENAKCIATDVDGMHPLGKESRFCIKRNFAIGRLDSDASNGCI